MIRSFGSKETAAVWEGKRPKTLPPDIIAPALKKLNMLSSATQLKTMADIASSRLEQIHSVPGLWSIRINQKYRIVFWWNDGWRKTSRLSITSIRRTNMTTMIKPKKENIPAGPSATSPYPGEYLLDDFLIPRGISQKTFAEHIGVAPVVINDICKGRRGLTPKLAMMIAKALGTELQFWLNAQISWEYAREVQRLKKTGELRTVNAIKPMKIMESVLA